MKLTQELIAGFSPYRTSHPNRFRLFELKERRLVLFALILSVVYLTQKVGDLAYANAPKLPLPILNGRKITKLSQNHPQKVNCQACACW
ncbi:MAG: hypothetical protein CTY16_03380 [Methylobacter sp.]|nr:MAG: hypothetical protein CTY16_03380 [Methylobacter sp.]